MEIPIQNIYYMLCYAWNKLEEGKHVRLETDDRPELVNLFAKVLINGINYLRKQGLDRGYVDYAEDTSTIRGKINFNETIKQNLLVKAKAYCEFDRLSYNVLHNRLLKSSISYLVKVDELDNDFKYQLSNILCWFDDVDYIPPTRTNFHRVQLNRNNTFYGFLLNVCELIVENLLVSERKGNTYFRDFRRNSGEMRVLFEHFVRNFYDLEQSKYSVDDRWIKWKGHALDSKSADCLGQMHTDITLSSDDRNIIIDTKFTPRTLASGFRTEKDRIHTGHLYQIFTYIVNADFPTEKKCEGILLYPTIDKHIDLKYELCGHPVRVC
ncbi:hypothetical protein KKB99_08345, partial [bacterium]|nr:hypothetical protein [bacterium]MBU1026000.1 hypothetical protein [bacterium]